MDESCGLVEGLTGEREIDAIGVGQILVDVLRDGVDEVFESMRHIESMRHFESYMRHIESCFEERYLNGQKRGIQIYN